MSDIVTGARRRSGILSRLKPGAFVWLIAPAALFTIVMTAFPFGFAVHLSLQHSLLGTNPHFVGLANYGRMLHDPVFWTGMGVTFSLYALALAAELVLGMYVALVLNRALAGVRILRTVLLSPLSMPAVAVGMMWLILLDPSFGSVNYLLQLVGLPKSLFLASPQLVVPTIAALDTWQYTPFIALILLGGLQALPTEPYEAAEIDGASRVQMFWRITIPLLRPSIVTAAILRSIDLLRFFDLIYITTQGGPGNASTTLNIYAYQMGFVFYHTDYASALMISLFAVVLIMVLVLTFLQRVGR